MSVSLETKLEYLTSCFEDQAWEDCAGHLADLFAFCAERIVPSRTGVAMTVAEAQAYYIGDSAAIDVCAVVELGKLAK